MGRLLLVLGVAKEVGGDRHLLTLEAGKELSFLKRMDRGTALLAVALVSQAPKERLRKEGVTKDTTKPDRHFSIMFHS